MAWRFNNGEYVQKGTLDNTTLGYTTGEIHFGGLGKVTMELAGDMQGDLKGKQLLFNNPDYNSETLEGAVQYMQDFSSTQKGEVGDIMADPYLYIEWYSKDNGRCVIELTYEAIGQINDAQNKYSE